MGRRREYQGERRGRGKRESQGETEGTSEEEGEEEGSLEGEGEGERIAEGEGKGAAEREDAQGEDKVGCRPEDNKISPTILVLLHLFDANTGLSSPADLWPAGPCYPSADVPQGPAGACARVPGFKKKIGVRLCVGTEPPRQTASSRSRGLYQLVETSEAGPNRAACKGIYVVRPYSHVVPPPSPFPPAP